MCARDCVGDAELKSKSLKIQSKRFYVDLKQNRRGKFIKIAEVSPLLNNERQKPASVGCENDKICTMESRFENLFLMTAPCAKFSCRRLYYYCSGKAVAVSQKLFFCTDREIISRKDLIRERQKWE